MKNKYYLDSQSMNQYGSFIDEADFVSAGRSNIDIDGTVTVRNEFLRSDYDYYKDIGTPKTIEEILYFCMKAYSRISIVRNVIDLMSDFGSQGIRLKHPNKRIERFYNQWFKKVEGKERSERFLNLLYRVGNVIVKRVDGKIKESTVKEMKKVHAALQQIPIRYDFLNPLSIRIENQYLATFSGDFKYYLKFGTGLRSDLTRAGNTRIVGITDEMSNTIKNKSEILLSNDKLHIFYYKKDDWQIWAEPIIYSLADDLIAFEKMRLADMTALDGAVCSIRLWTLGHIDPTNPANNLIPGPAAINKVRNLLRNAVQGQQLDLVWGPDLKFQESSSQSYRYLGSAKYETVLNCIYDGLGVPPTLRSGAQTKGGGSTSFIALKTLIERLQYGRDRLTAFWDEQIKRVQKAMGFAHPAKVVFDKVIMADEAGMMKLLIELADRDIISSDSLLEKFDFLPDIEKIRVKQENKQRGKRLPYKASPFHNPLWDVKIKEAMVLQGLIPGSDIGLPYDKKLEPKLPAGRPKNVKETQKRKVKPLGPRTLKNTAMADMIIWANNAYKDISEILSSALLGIFKKKNFRQLSTEQANQAEVVKFGVLCGLDPYTDINEEIVYNLLDKDIPNAYLTIVDQLIKIFQEYNNRVPSMDEIRSIYANAYVLQHIESNE